MSGNLKAFGINMAEEALSQPKPTTDAARWNSGANHRTMVRYRCAPATPGKLFFDVEEECRWVWLLNLSQGGVGFLTGNTIPEGTIITLHIRNQDTREIAQVAAQVMHSTLQRDGDFLIGCEFLQPLNLAQLDDLL